MSALIGVTEAARRLGVSAVTIRNAIRAERLNAVFDNGQYWIQPEDLASLRVGTRGPSAPLEVRMGTADDRVLHLAHDGEFERLGAVDHVVTGRVSRWSRAAIKTVCKDNPLAKSTRCILLVPGPDVNVFTNGPLEVRGRFRVTTKINASERALAAWRACRGEMEKA